MHGKTTGKQVTDTILDQFIALVKAYAAHKTDVHIRSCGPLE